MAPLPPVVKPAQLPVTKSEQKPNIHHVQSPAPLGSSPQPVAPVPVIPSQPEQRPLPVQPSLEMGENYDETGIDDQGSVKAPRKEKPPKIMNGWVYREVSQRGGMRWFLGEPEKEYIARKEQKEREKLEGIQDGDGGAGNDYVQEIEQQPIPMQPQNFEHVTPPNPLPLTEQKPNDHVYVETQQKADPPTAPVQMGTQTNGSSISLEEGSNISL